MGLSKRDQNRVINSARNIVTSAVFQFVLGFTAFAERTVFIKCLNADYLGLNTLFSNILYVLSIAELGIGSAIAFALYAPLANHDNRKVHIYMRFFKKAYNIIGTVIILVGLILSPFVKKLASSEDSINYVSFYFVIYLFAIGFSYFFSYRQILIEADQKKYINQTIICLGSIFQQLIQIVVLLLTRNYALYLFVFLVFNIGKNVVISKIAKKLYPSIKDSKYKEEQLDHSEKRRISLNIRAMCYHKFGEVAIGSSDSILISYLVNIATLGIYANYQIILEAIRSAMRIFYSSVLASIGNMCATEDTDKIYYSFKTLNFTNYLLFSFTTIAIFNLIQPIITIWLGSSFILEQSSVLLIALMFFMTGSRQMLLNFHDAYGLFWADKYKRVLEAIVNLVLSIFLGKKYGLNGIFIGTIASNLVGFGIEGYVVYKYAFQRSCLSYIFMYFRQIFATLILAYLIYFLGSFIHTSILIELLLKSILCLIIPIAFYSLIYRKKRDFIAMKRNIIDIIKLFIARK